MTEESNIPSVLRVTDLGVPVEEKRDVRPTLNTMQGASNGHPTDESNKGYWYIPRRVQNIWRRYRTDKMVKENCSYTICIYISFFIIGWRKGQFGPSYIDLRLISGTDLEQGSWIITTIFVGYTLGSFVQGCIYTRVNWKLMFSAALVLMGVAIATVPWCVMIEVMLPTYVIVGLMQGVIDAGGNAELLRVWKQEGRVVVLGLNFIFSVGSVVAPMVVAPFLTEPEAEGMKNASTSWLTLPYQQNKTEVNKTHDLNSTKFQSRVYTSTTQSYIYIPFSITGGLSLIISSLFVIAYVRHDRKYESQITADTGMAARNLPQSSKVVMLLIISTMFLVHNAIDDTFIGLLSSYCVERFDWSKKEGSYLSTTFFFFVLGARFISFTFEKYMNTLVFLGINFTLMFLSVLGLLVISVHMLDSGVWVFVSLFGFATSCVFALMLSWTNEYITMVTGKIASLYFVSAMIGSALNPLLLGFLMKQFDPIWFCYLFLIEIIVQFSLFTTGVLGTKYIVKKFGKTFHTHS